MLGDDVFGVDLARIKEILSLPPITLVPRAPASIVGVMRWSVTPCAGSPRYRAQLTEFNPA